MKRGEMIALMALLIVQSRNTHSIAVSYNQPHFDQCASWNPNGTTFANVSMIGQYPYGLFVSSNDSVYVVGFRTGTTYVWLRGSSSPIRNISTTGNQSRSVFATLSGDIYLDNGNMRRVEKWAANNSNESEWAMTASSNCFGLFIDSNNTLYCSMYYWHRVFKRSLNSNTSVPLLAAGTKCAGENADQLIYPWGIFVHANFSLYVADSGNDRIQYFAPQSSNATTVAGSGAPGTVVLNRPTGIVLDADDYLFIVDSRNHRIIASSPVGFRCVAGCSGRAGGARHQLLNPMQMSFDTQGNIFVSDYSNHRVQTFLLATNSCQTRTTEMPHPASDPQVLYTTRRTDLELTAPSTLFPPLGISYNLPKFCPSAAWDPNGITWANESLLGQDFRAAFVDSNNTIYISGYTNGRIHIWLDGNLTRKKNLSATTTYSRSLFVTSTGDIFVDKGSSQFIEKLTSSGNKTTAMQVSQSCFGLFVAINHDIYCSISALHQIVKQSGDTDVDDASIIAGTGCSGSKSTELSAPHGIFVDRNFSLYVADTNNDRIQFFPVGQKNGTTLVGGKYNKSVALSRPTSVILDARGSLFIADTNNYRIVISGSNGSRCIVGCSRSTGGGTSPLWRPHTMNFDRDGNIFVIDLNNSRMQKFLLAKNSCAIPKIPNFVVPQCNNSSFIGRDCNISADACDLLKPCPSHATCINSRSFHRGYFCRCPPGFNGTACQFDLRPCQNDTCWNGGHCQNVSSSDFVCVCENGWSGSQCESKVDYCANVTCQNGGVCRGLLLGYKCECASTSHSGRHCETVENSLVVRQVVGKSLGYIGLVSILSVFVFVVVLDLLKYVFHIDPAGEDREHLRRKKARKKAVKRIVVVRYIYVNYDWYRSNN